MIKRIIIATTFVALTFGSYSLCYSQGDILIIDFLLKNSRICNSENKCEIVPTSTLPDPKKSIITVVNFDKATGMVMFFNNGKEIWIPQSIIELNKKAVASSICKKGGNGGLDEKHDITSIAQENYSTVNLGEDCN